MFCHATDIKYANSKNEEELSILIFDRSKKPIQLTDIGQRLSIKPKHCQ
jgi:DNA-binding transcriptional LysR family regulator